MVMLKCCVLVWCLFIQSTISSQEHFYDQLNTCHTGDVVRNECNKCVCSSKTIFECKSLDCNVTIGFKTALIANEVCIPNQLYTKNSITCICTKDGHWPHKSCENTFLSLPLNKLRKFKCEPNTYTKIDCNICKCDANGNVNIDRCTKNNCDGDTSRRADTDRDPKKASVYSNCIVDNWYSLAPCQFCYCVNENKLVCNTGHYYSKKIDVGKYNMEICGKDLIKEAVELVPEKSRQLRINEGELTTEKQETTTRGKVSKGHTINNAVLQRDSSENESENPDEGEEAEDEADDIESESEDEKPSSKFHTTTTSTTTLKPKKTTKQDNDDSESDEDSNLNESNEQSDEMDVDAGRVTSPKSVESDERMSSSESKKRSEITNEDKPKPKNSYGDLEYADNTLKINLPNVLNKVFELALRKSMVSLNNATDCTPGETSMSGCNMCFCLKNGKLLCTANKSC